MWRLEGSGSMAITARAISKNRWASARKVRRVADMVRGMTVDEALNLLHFEPASASTPIEKTVRSAMANLLEKEEAQRLVEDEVIVSKIMVNEGPTYKRLRFRAMGRAFRVRKRTCHISVEVTAEWEEPESAES
jgi:large subunit ribosomal protein L22